MSYFEDNIKRVLAKNETYDNIGYHLAKLLADSFLSFYEIKSEADSELVNCFKNEVTNLIRSYKVEDYQKFLDDKIHLKVFIKDLDYLLKNNAKISNLLETRTKKYFEQLNPQQKDALQKKIDEKINLPFFCEKSIDLIKQKLQHETEVKKALLGLREFKNKSDKEFVLSLTEVLNLDQDEKSLEIQLINLNSSLEALILMRVNLANLKNLSQDKWKKYLGLEINKEQILKLSILVNDYYKDRELDFIDKYQNITTLAKNKEIDDLDFSDEENLENIRGLINYGNVETAVTNLLSRSGETKRKKASISSRQPTSFSHKFKSDNENKEDENKKRGSYLSDSEIKKHIDQQIRNPEFVAWWQNLTIEQQRNIWGDLKKRNYNVLQPITSKFDKKTGIEYEECPPDDILYRYLREVDNENKLLDSKTKENKNLISRFNQSEKEALIQNLPEETKKRLKEKIGLDFNDISTKNIEDALGYLEPAEISHAIKQTIFNQEKYKLETEKEQTNSSHSNQPTQNLTRNSTPAYSGKNSPTQENNKEIQNGSYTYKGKVGQIPNEKEFRDEKVHAIWDSFTNEDKEKLHGKMMDPELIDEFGNISMGHLEKREIYAHSNSLKELVKIKQSEIKNLSNAQVEEISQKLNISPTELKSENGAKKAPLELINKFSTQNKNQTISKAVVSASVSKNNFNNLTQQQQKLLAAKKEQEQAQFIEELKKRNKSKREFIRSSNQ